MSRSKKQKIDDMMDDFSSPTQDNPKRAFTGYDDEIFAALDNAQVTSDTLPIMSICADITQPRRIVPRDIRGTWAGHPKGWPNIIQRWEEYVYDSGLDLPIEDILRGKANPFDYMNQDPIVKGFIELLDLAGQIHDVGLQQRIGVKPRGKEYIIIYGERRWSAFNLLHYYLGDDYASIPAKVAHVSEWELAKIQAAENFHHVELNAISKARQFAKLLMVANAEEGNYDSWNALVAEGGCDRPYYAQVANGDLHPIPYGMGAQFEQTLGISTGQMRQYRNLLKLTDDYEVNNAVWDLGDENDWTEGFMRDIGKHLKVKTVQEILRSVTTVTVLETASHIKSELREAIAHAKASKPKPVAATPALPDENKSLPSSTGGDLEEANWSTHVGGGIVEAGDTVLVHSPEGGFRATVIGPSQLKGQIKVKSEDGRILSYYKSALTRIDNDESLPSPAGGDTEGGDTLLNKRVELDDGVTGIVSYIDGEHIRIIRDDNARTLHITRGYIVAILDEEAETSNGMSAEQTPYQIGDKVWVYRGDGRKDKGEVRYIKDGLYGVFKFVSGTTHYYNEEQLEIWNSDEGSDNTVSQHSLTSSQWVGKPALVETNDGDLRVIVTATDGTEAVWVEDGSGKRKSFPIRLLSPAPEIPGQRLTEYYDQPPTTNGTTGGHEPSNPVKPKNEPAIKRDNNARAVIGFLSGLTYSMDKDQQERQQLEEILEGCLQLTTDEARYMAENDELAAYLKSLDIVIQEMLDHMYLLVDSVSEDIKEAAQQ